MNGTSDNPKRVIVIGDAMVDSYLIGAAAGISDEAPVMVLDWQTIRHAMGGMLNVAASIAADPSLAVMTFAMLNREDEAGQWMLNAARDAGLNTHWFEDGRPTIEKMRVGVDDEQTQVARIDHEHTHAVEASVASELVCALETHASTAAAIVVSDYDKGIMSAPVIKAVMRVTEEHGIPLFVDTKPPRMDAYTGATWWTPNESEATAFARLHGWPTDDIESVATRMSDHLGGTVVITRDARGVIVAGSTDDVMTNPAIGDPSTVCSTSGAGDVFLASLVIAQLRGESAERSVAFAQTQVATSIQRDGTCTLRAADLG